MPNRSRHSKKGERGRSLVETVFYLGVIGVGIMAALKGAAFVETMRSVATMWELPRYQMMFHRYYESFGAFPGDDAQASARWDRPKSLMNTIAGPVTYDGDSIINGVLQNPTDPLAETYLAWRDFRHAGYLDGDIEAVGESALPENYFGGVYALAEENLGLSQVICMTNVPGRAAEMIDRRLDNGTPGGGFMLATSQFDLERNNVFPEPDDGLYDFDKSYIMCTAYWPR